jgi:hypothetical protein
MIFPGRALLRTMVDVAARDWSRAKDRGALEISWDHGPHCDGDRFPSAVLPGTLGGSISTSAGPSAIRPVCVELPYAFDEAGVDYPADTVGVMCHSVGRMSFTTLSASGVVSTAVNRDKHYLGTAFHIWGMAPGTTVTVEWLRNTDWQSLGVPGTVEFTHTFDADDGPDQVVYCPVISAPQTQRRFCWLYARATWTTAPQRVGFSQVPWTNGAATGIMKVVPSVLPVGWTERPEVDDVGGDYGRGIAPYPSAVYFRPTIGGMKNWRFARDVSLSVTAGVPTRTAASYVDGRRFGRAELLENARVPAQFALSLPCAWIGGQLKQHSWGPSCTESMQIHGEQAISTVSADWLIHQSIGQGWRNVRVHLAAYLESGGGRSLTNITIKVLVDGVLKATQSASSVSASVDPGDIYDFPDIYPATDKMDAVLTVTTTCTLSGGGSAPTCTSTTRPSLRCDIPMLFSCAGPGGVAPGGYMPSKLSSPSALGSVAHYSNNPGTHFFAGSPSVVMNVLSFIPATTGLYSCNGSASGGANACGEYLFSYNRRRSAICRAGKRAFAAANGTFAAGDTITIASVARVNNALAGSPLTITAGMLTDQGSFFGSISLPAAGSYRIQVKGRGSAGISGTAGPSLYLAYSASDQWCADPDAAAIDSPMAFGGILAEQATPPASPSSGAGYLVAADATGAWADHDGEIAYYILGSWRFHVLAIGFRYCFLIGTTYHWRDAGGTWRTISDPRCDVMVTVAAAQTVYVRLGSYDPQRWDSNDSPLLRNTAVTIEWAAA